MKENTIKNIMSVFLISSKLFIQTAVPPEAKESVKGQPTLEKQPKKIIPKLSGKNLLKLAFIYKQQAAIKTEINKRSQEQGIKFEKWRQKTSLITNKNNIDCLYPGAFKGLGDLNGVSIQNEPLTELAPRTFQGLESLQLLNLSRNQIKKLAPNTFQGLGNVIWLNLNDNQLKKIDKETFKGLDKLQLLLLNGNQLEKLAAESFQMLGNLKLLDLQENPFQPENINILRKRLPNVEIIFYY